MITLPSTTLFGPDVLGRDALELRRIFLLVHASFPGNSRGAKKRNPSGTNGAKRAGGQVTPRSLAA